jgi:predicted HTH domain antitoxin
MSGSRFLAMWDCDGLECMFDITGIEHDAMLAGLKNEAFKLPFNLTALMLRARYNSQRSYEIYTFETQDDISLNEMIEMFNENPQYFAELIRDKGNKIYSDYTPSSRKVIV